MHRHTRWPLGIAGALLLLAACEGNDPTNGPDPLAVQFDMRTDDFHRCGTHGTLDLGVDHFADGSWVRTNSTSTVGSAFISQDAGYDDGFAIPCRLNGAWDVEVEARIISGGRNYVFPWLLIQFSDGSFIRTTSLPDSKFGWALGVCVSEWPESQVGPTGPETCTPEMWKAGDPPSVIEGNFLVLRVSARHDRLRLYARPADQQKLQLAREIPYSMNGKFVRRLAIIQPWDAYVEVTRIEER